MENTNFVPFESYLTISEFTANMQKPKWVNVTKKDGSKTIVLKDAANRFSSLIAWASNKLAGMSAEELNHTPLCVGVWRNNEGVECYTFFGMTEEEGVDVLVD